MPVRRAAHSFLSLAHVERQGVPVHVPLQTLCGASVYNHHAIDAVGGPRAVPAGQDLRARCVPDVELECDVCRAKHIPQ